MNGDILAPQVYNVNVLMLLNKFKLYFKTVALFNEWNSNSVFGI